MYLIIGSEALLHWYSDSEISDDYFSRFIRNRTTKDIDVITDVIDISELPKETITGKRFEYHWDEDFKILDEINVGARYIDKDLLYTLKVSHAKYNINWMKHMIDIGFMNYMGCKIHEEFFSVAEGVWKKRHTRPKIDLKKTNEEFFVDGVSRKQEHDKLHDMLKFYDCPMYEKIKDDKSMAYCSETLFNELSYQDKLLTCLEEIYVIATERYLDKKQQNFKEAKLKAYKNLVISMTDGFFNRFLIENNMALIKDAKEFDSIWITRINTGKYNDNI